ncbi:gamma-glutamyl-gamma-aminobutyrate hydrolase family protein [Akkermansiaceae bacterium]|nr:gamma-glutamyl-gamma-aminobutyrate hydrolase family protein [Akkermansiaceae bacterium]
MKTSLALVLLSLLSPLGAQDRPEIPEDLLDDEHFRTESGLNDFTVPSIVKVFDELEKISPLTYSADHLKQHERLPLDRTKLALRLGTLIADGFIAVQTGHSDDVPIIASHLSRYAKALGAGERIKRHAAALLDHAKAKDLVKLKEALAATQRDVERELVSLRDPDLSHHEGKSVFKGLSNPFEATRYHSLIVKKETLPDCLEVTAWTDDGIIMGLKHKELNVHGVQFHPESILTDEGKALLKNFLEM